MPRSVHVVDAPVPCRRRPGERFSQLFLPVSFLTSPLANRSADSIGIDFVDAHLLPCAFWGDADDLHQIRPDSHLAGSDRARAGRVTRAHERQRRHGDHQEGYIAWGPWFPGSTASRLNSADLNPSSGVPSRSRWARRSPSTSRSTSRSKQRRSMSWRRRLWWSLRARTSRRQ